MPKITPEKRRFFLTIADQFDNLMNVYDMQRRLEIVYEELLPGDIKGKKLVDIGAGTGWFSSRAHQREAEVYSLDIGLELLVEVRKKVKAREIAGNTMDLPFRENSFEIVISSEVIEHTDSPEKAVHEMARILKPGGIMIVTCPNRIWLWAVHLANFLKIRPFHGHEDMPSFNQLERFVNSAGLEIEKHIGFHPWPFQIRFLQDLSRKVDHHFAETFWGRFMINQAIRCRKPVDPRKSKEPGA